MLFTKLAITSLDQGHGPMRFKLLSSIETIVMRSSIPESGDKVQVIPPARSSIETKGPLNTINSKKLKSAAKTSEQIVAKETLSKDNLGKREGNVKFMSRIFLT